LAACQETTSMKSPVLKTC